MCYANLKIVKNDGHQFDATDPTPHNGNGSKPRVQITLARYEEMRSYWAEKPTIAHVAKKARLSPSVVQRVVTKGVPELGLDPFPQSEHVPARDKDALPRGPSRTTIERAKSAVGLESLQEAELLEDEIRNRIRNYEKEAVKLDRDIDMMRRRGVSETSLEQLRSAFGRIEGMERVLERVKREAVAADQIKKSAEEAAASRLTLRTAASVAAMVSHLTEKVLIGIEDGSIELPSVLDTKTIVALARAADTSASAVERAMTIERKRLGQPEQVLGIQIGALLSDVTDEELEWITKNQQMPPRLVSSAMKPALDVTEESATDDE